MPLEYYKWEITKIWKPLEWTRQKCFKKFQNKIQWRTWVSSNPFRKKIFKRHGEERDANIPCIVFDTSRIKGNVRQLVNGLVEDFQLMAMDVQRAITEKLRLFVKYNMENMITIANSGAINHLLHSWGLQIRRRKKMPWQHCWICQLMTTRLKL